MKIIFIYILFIFAASASATHTLKYEKISECVGQSTVSDANVSIQVFQEKNEPRGILFVTIDVRSEDLYGKWYEAIPTDIGWNNPDGFPHVMNNEIQLDYRISDVDTSFTTMSFSEETYNVGCYYSTNTM